MKWNCGQTMGEFSVLVCVCEWVRVCMHRRKATWQSRNMKFNTNKVWDIAFQFQFFPIYLVHTIHWHFDWHVCVQHGWLRFSHSNALPIAQPFRSRSFSHAYTHNYETYEIVSDSISFFLWLFCYCYCCCFEFVSVFSRCLFCAVLRLHRIHWLDRKKVFPPRVTMTILLISKSNELFAFSIKFQLFIVIFCSLFLFTRTRSDPMGKWSIQIAHDFQRWLPDQSTEMQIWARTVPSKRVPIGHRVPVAVGRRKRLAPSHHHQTDFAWHSRSLERTKY